MRVIAGIYKRRLLEYPKDEEGLRPTKDMVKEAVFSSIQNRIAGASFLDLYAGVGSIGLEALSRGAEQVMLIDKDPSYIFKNAKTLGCLDKLEIYKNDARRALPLLGHKKALFDFIYVDPPYNTDLAEDSLNKIIHFGILKKDGMVIVETARAKEIDTAGYTLIAEKIYGETKILYLGLLT